MKIPVRRRTPDSRCPFVYPLPRTPRVALLDARISPGANVRYFDVSSPGELQQLMDFQPQAFAGELRHLRALASGIGSSLLTRLEPRLIVVFTAAGSPLLTSGERDELWSVFQAPAFEQYVSPRGELIASECEAHAGLHIHGIFDPQSLREGAIETGQCGCGQTSPRLVNKAGTTAAVAA
jgi:hypothetical protein